MKKTLLVLGLVLLVVLPLSAAKYDAAKDSLGIGLSLGYPMNGVAAKYNLGDIRLTGTLGVYGASLGIDAGAQIDITEFDIDGNTLYVNAGAALGIRFGAAFILGVDFPVGVSYYFKAGDNMKLEAFFKLAPGIKLLDSVGFEFGAALGALYYLD